MKIFLDTANIAEIKEGDYTIIDTIGRLKDGTEHVRHQYRGPWEPETPPGWEALGAKFRSCARGVIQADRIERAMALLHDLDRLDNVGRVMDLVRG